MFALKCAIKQQLKWERERQTAHPIRLQARESENERLSEEKSQQQRGKQRSVATFHQKANSTLTSVCVWVSVCVIWLRDSDNALSTVKAPKHSLHSERAREQVESVYRKRERERNCQRAHKREKERVVEHTTSPTQSARATVARRQQQQRQHSISNSKEKRAENIYRLSKCLL